VFVKNMKHDVFYIKINSYYLSLLFKDEKGKFISLDVLLQML
jgi:hypothetical protein